MKLGNELEEIVFRGEADEKRILYSFDEQTSIPDIVKKFQMFSKINYSRYFKYDDAPFHRDIIESVVLAYLGQKYDEVVLAMFRGSAKTSLIKMIVVFFILNDKRVNRRRFLKIASREMGNAKQIVIDVFNMILEVAHVYPTVLESETDALKKTQEKREQTMSSFMTTTGVKVTANTVGKGGRGNLQDAYRPDWIWFEDIEDRKLLRSPREIMNVWESVNEAIEGRAIGGVRFYTLNYLSEAGNVHKIIDKARQAGNKVMIQAIMDKKGQPTWPDAYALNDVEAERLKAIDGKQRESIENIQKNAEDWEGEYMSNPASAGELFFNRVELEEQKTLEPISITGGFKVFYPFDPSHRYAGGMDISKGVGLDSSTSVFIDFTQFPARVVGTYANNNINPVIFGREMARQGKLFGTCLVAPENNYETAAINELSHFYPNSMIYKMKVQPKIKTIVGTPTTFGWNTNSATKGTMLQDLQKAVSDGHLLLTDENLINELKSYTINNLYDRDTDPRLTTRHFDLLIAVAIAWQMRNEARVTNSLATQRQSRMISGAKNSNHR